MTVKFEEYKQEVNDRIADLERSRELFQSCLTASIEICKLMLEDLRDNADELEEEGVVVGALNIDQQIVPIIERELKVTANEEQRSATGQMISAGLMRHGLRSRVMWYIAHNLEHIFLDEVGPTQH